MKKPFDVPIEELLHGLALVAVAELARGKDFSHKQYYDEYLSELNFFKEAVQKYSEEN